MKRKALALISVVTLLFSVVAGTQFVNSVEANPFFETRVASPPTVTIHSPANETCVNQVLLDFTVEKPEVWITTAGSFGYAQSFDGVSYEIDGKYYGSVDNIDRNLASSLNYHVYLTNLTDGAHTLTVRAYATGYVIEMHGLWGYYVPINSSTEIHFTLDTTSPMVSVMSLENKTYYTSDLPLNFTVNEVTSQVSYSLDGEENKTLAKNTILTNLSFGAHNVTVYAIDNAGNIGSETFNFTRAEPPEPFPTTLVIASIVTVAVIGIGLVMHFKKLKR
jgi:hypothetical protein